MSDHKTVSIAMVGCGAVAELFHLPSVARSRDCSLALLVEKDVKRGRMLAKTYRGAAVTEEYRDIKGRADAAVVALPHHLHETVCSELLASGVHVLVEKPMALSAAQCTTMNEAARSGNAVLAVGLLRRFYPSTVWLHEVIQAKVFGPVTSFDIQEGFPYNWPVHSDFFLRKETAGGGVLLDTGAHTLDQMLYWFGDVASFDYYDDSYGGVEADCRLEVAMASGVRGCVELSRTRALRNTAIVEFEHVIVEAALGQDALRLSAKGASMDLVGHGRVATEVMGAPEAKLQKDLFDDQLADFAAAIRGEAPARVSGEEAARSITLIEQCYAARKPLDLPWLRFEPASGNG